MLNFNGFERVYQTLVTELKKYDENIEVATTAEGTNLPLVVVEDIDYRSVNRTYGGIESYSSLSVQVNIYARQKRIKNVTLSGRKIAHDIACEVDDILTNKLGMNRTSSRSLSTMDESIYRYVMIYEVLQNDSKNYFI